MRPLTFKTKTWIYVSFFTAVILTIAFILLGASYYWFSLNSFKKDLVFASRQIITNHLVFENNQILFKRDNMGRTISAYLRDENFSAVFLDANLKPFAVYGIFQSFNDNDLVQKIGMEKTKKVYELNQPSFGTSELVTGEEYFVLSMPVLYQGNKIGLIQLAMIQPLFSKVEAVGIYMLIGVIFLSFVISWPLSRMLVDFMFRPLDDVTRAMEKARVTNLNVPLKYGGNPSDEIAVLVKSYNDLLSRLAEGFEKQKSFISNASHELKTPLSRAISTLDILTMEMEDKNFEVTPTRMDELRGDLFTFSRMIDELLLLSRIDSGAIELKMAPIKLKELMKDIYGIHLGEINNKGIIFEEKYDDGLVINADQMYLKLILTNLVSNAIKYSENGGKVEIDFKDGVLSIRDYGQGMSEEDFEHVFDRFYRAAKTKKISGFGVGMSLVKQLCEIHKINISYDKGLEKGTRVSLKW